MFTSLRAGRRVAWLACSFALASGSVSLATAQTASKSAAAAKQLTEALDLPLSTVKSRLYTALKQLQMRLRKFEDRN